jgi:TRAP-type uncharacterized transport system substrate-binding protein
VAFAIAAYFLLSQRSQKTYQVRMTAGTPVDLRHQLALLLAGEAQKHGISIQVRGTVGSEESFQEVNAGVLDLALAQGGLAHEEHPNVRQVAVLHIEPMHLLVKAEIHDEVSKSLSALRGKQINLGKEGSGTHWLALDTLRFAGLRPRNAAGKGDYIVKTFSQQEFESATDRDKLPDAIFLLTTMPSRIARHLVTKFRYRLVPLRFGEAFSLDALSGDQHPGRQLKDTPDIEKLHICDTVIPAFTYQVEPGVPSESIHTLGTHLLLVANKNVDPYVTEKLLEVVYNSQFAQVAKPPLNDSLLQLPPELPLHSGTELYLQRNKPVITGDLLDFLEKATTIAGPLLGGLFFLWQLFRQRYRRLRDAGFEHYILAVTEVERRALQLETTAVPDLRSLLRLQQDLSRLKTEALAKFVDGELEGEELMSSFLAHVNDARNYLARLILHERDNLEHEAQLQGRPLKSLWSEALTSGKQTLTGAEPTKTTLGEDRTTDDDGTTRHQNFQAPVQST